MPGIKKRVVLSDNDIRLAAETIERVYKESDGRDPYPETAIQRIRDRQRLTAAQADHAARVLRAEANKRNAESRKPALDLFGLEPTKGTLEHLADVFEDRSRTAHDQVRRDRRY